MTADTAPRCDTSPPTAPASGRCPAAYRKDMARELATEIETVARKVDAFAEALRVDLGASDLEKAAVAAAATLRIFVRKLGSFA